MSYQIHGWRMTGPGAVERFTRTAENPGPRRVLVEVAGCGVCHTDLGYLYGGVPTRAKLPLALGHEISGVVVAAGPGAEKWMNRRVVVPAVWPCGECRPCQEDRATACGASVMPGNDADGGFQSHVEVPSRWLCGVDRGAGPGRDDVVGREELSLWQLSVVADAVSTPLQAIKRCHLRSGELAVVVGAGGVGIFGVQLARATGAQVVALDVDPKKLERASRMGAVLTLDARTPGKEVKKSIGAFARERGLPESGWRIFEMSGHPQGQELAFGLITRGGSISVVGYTSQPVSLRLSNLMALDATAYGNWGCDPALYPEALVRVLSGDVQLRSLVRREKLEDAPKVLEAVHHGEYSERVVLVP